jgi:AhpD family alkylhydroperoxidase
MINGSVKKLYSVPESYRIYYDGLRTARYMSRARRNKDLEPEFMERIMIAVTGVNDCSICSYAHTKMALEMGMDNKEILKLLSGIIENVPSEEAPGIIFAQHYADSRAHPSREAWERLVDIYGLPKAMGILGAVRMIMVGNVYGIPWGSFFNRFAGKSDKRSSLPYEARMIITCILFTPVVIIHAMVSNLFRKPVISI